MEKRASSSEPPKMLKVLESIKEGEQSSEKDLVNIAKYIINQMKDDGAFTNHNSNSHSIRSSSRVSDASIAASESGHTESPANLTEKDVDKQLVSLRSGDLIWLRNEGKEEKILTLL
jgi:hypothetical protein